MIIISIHRSNIMIAGDNRGREVPEEGSSAMIIRNQDHTLSRLTDHAAGISGPSLLVHSLTASQANSYTNVHTKV